MEISGLMGTDEDAEARAMDSFRVCLNMPISRIMGPDGKVDEQDKTTIGHGYPKFTVGWTNLITYKNFELSFLITGSYGNDLFNTMRIRRETYEATILKCGITGRLTTRIPIFLHYTTENGLKTRTW